MVSTGGMIVVAVVSGYVAGSPALTVYALSFWHYLLYWWAYRHGAVAPKRFRNDAGLMKTLALLALAWAYLPLQTPLATVVVVAGFGMNAVAARALGLERTYYGWELGDVSHERVTAFPYSVVPHPMLLGNLVAYGGTLLSADFRAAWWPLAIGHVAMNAGLLVMETAVTPRRVRVTAAHHCRHSGLGLPWPDASRLGIALGAAAGAAAGLAAATVSGCPAGRAPLAAVSASAAAHAIFMAGRYLAPSGMRLSGPPSRQQED